MGIFNTTRRRLPNVAATTDSDRAEHAEQLQNVSSLLRKVKLAQKKAAIKLWSLTENNIDDNARKSEAVQSAAIDVTTLAKATREELEREEAWRTLKQSVEYAQTKLQDNGLQRAFDALYSKRATKF